MKISTVPVQRINPAPYNPRTDLRPGDPEYERLRRSIDEFGLVEPLVWNERTGHLVGGHQRFKVLLAEGHAELQVSVVDLPPEREKALNVALNKIAGSWDERKLAELLDELTRVDGFDVTLTGFELPDVRGLVAEHLLARGEDDGFDLSSVLDESRPAVTQPGELIVLGSDPRLRHRLLCGDSTNPEDVQKLMGGEKAVLMATDPPYLVDYDGTSCSGISGRFESKRWDAYKDPAAGVEFFASFLGAAVGHALTGSPAIYQWHASNRFPLVERAWRDNGLLPHQTIVWTKESAVPGRCAFMQQHEPCLFGWIQGKMPKRKPPPNATTVWNIPRKSENLNVHPTQKPLEIFRRPIQWHTRPGELVYEPFCGSGTQLIAAHSLGRRCCAMEQSPRFCDAIVRRFIAAAGPQSVGPEIAERYVLPLPAGATP